MALISIKIKEFDNAKGYSGDAKDEALDYRDALNDKIISKMNKYSGSGSSNISQAKKLVNEKRTQLSDKADSFGQLEKDIGTLRTNIVNAETNLTNKIETVVGNFCNKYGLKSERSLFAQFFDWAFGDIDDALAKFFKNISVNFKNWYRYNGGKEKLAMVGKILLGVVALVALVAAVIALPGLVAALATAIATGAGVLSAIGALVGGVATLVTASIGLATAVVQAGYAVQSYTAASGNDPVWGRRYATHSDEEDVFSALRRNGHYDLAHHLEVANIIASAISIVTSITGFAGSVKNAGGWKNFFKNGIANIKSNWKNFTKDPGKLLKQLLWKDTKTAFKTLQNAGKMIANVWDVGASALETMVGTDTNAFVNSLLKAFGSTADMAIGYLNKLSQQDLFTKMSLGTNIDAYQKLANDAKANNSLDAARLQRQADIAYAFIKDLKLTSSTGDLIKTLTKDLPKHIADIQNVVIGDNLTQFNFQYDDGTRFGDSLKSWTSFEKMLPKVFDLTGIEMPKGWLGTTLKVALVSSIKIPTLQVLSGAVLVNTML